MKTNALITLLQIVNTMMGMSIARMKEVVENMNTPGLETDEIEEAVSVLVKSGHLKESQPNVFQITDDGRSCVAEAVEAGRWWQDSDLIFHPAKVPGSALWIDGKLA